MKKENINSSANLSSRYRHLLFFILLISNFSLLSQEYRAVFEEKYNVSKDSAKVYCNKLIRSMNPSEKAFGYSAKGYMLSKESNYKLAEELFHISFKEIDNIKNTQLQLEEKIYILYYYSRHLLAEHTLELANEKINEGLRLSEELNNVVMQIKFKNLIGRSFSLLGLGEKAIKNGKNTIRDIKSLEQSLPSSFYNNSLFYAHLNTGNRTLNYYLQDSVKNASYLDSTKHYLNAAQNFISLKNYKLSSEQKMHLLNLNADVSYFKKNYKNAIAYYEQSLKIVSSENFGKRIFQIKFALAECYFFSGDLKTTKQILDELSSKDLNQYSLLKNKALINYYYAQIHLKSGDISKALKYTDSFNNQLDAYYKNISDLKVSIFTDNELRKKKEILDKLFKEKQTNSDLIFYLKTGGASALILIILTVIYLKRQRRRFETKIDSLVKHIDNLENKKGSSTPKIDEAKALEILKRLKEIESLELFTSQDYSLNMVAKKIESNSVYVSMVINDYWKKSFIQYTNELRVNYILLKLKEDPVYQKFTLIAIAESAGYKSLRSFNKHFKSITELTPKQYLKYLKSKN